MAETAAKRLGITFIPGVEITCERGIEPDVEELSRQNREEHQNHGTCWLISPT